MEDVKKIFKRKSITTEQVAGASFGCPLLICFLNICHDDFSLREKLKFKTRMVHTHYQN